MSRIGTPLPVMTETALGPHPVARLLAPGIAGVGVGRRPRRTGPPTGLHRCRQLWRVTRSFPHRTVFPEEAGTTAEVRKAPVPGKRHLNGLLVQRLFQA
jgi:hypothetical protein